MAPAVCAASPAASARSFDCAIWRSLGDVEEHAAAHATTNAILKTTAFNKHPLDTFRLFLKSGG
jgi:hypothetical protein